MIPLTLALAALVAWMGGVLAGCTPATPAAPDVILIDLESVRADHLSHAGYPQPTAVRLDEFRSRSAWFSHARTPSSTSVAGSAALLTGLSPASLRRIAHGPGLAPGHQTLAEILRERGWYTVGVSHHPDVGAGNGFGQGFDRFDGASGRAEDHPDAESMVAWLREWLAGAPPEPFFLYLHPMNAGPPYRVPQDQQDVLFGRRPSALLPWDGERMRAVRTGGATLTEPEVTSLVETYDTALRYTLDRVAELLSILEKTGHLDGALVIVTANHGEELFDHGGFGHGRTLYEEVLRVPLYVKLPGASAAASFDAPVSTLDVVPTVVDVLGIPPTDTDGYSLAPLLRGEPEGAGERDFVHELGAPGESLRLRALIRGRHKLIDTEAVAAGAAAPSAQLFDLVLDPREARDLAAGSPEIVDSLRRELGARD